MVALNNVDVEHVIGDTRDKNSIREAMRGCDTVFHTAAVVTYWKPKYPELMDVNVNGTQNVVEVCLEAGIEKLVHTSSVAALGYRTDGQLIDETTQYNWARTDGYRYSKHLSELAVLEGVSRSLNATIVNPSVIIGPRDAYVHGGQIVRDIKKGIIPAYVEGGMNIVGVKDVVAGHLAAATKGRSGERYILGGINLTHKEVFELAARVLNGRAPKIKAPTWGAKAIARTFDFIGTITRTQPWITSDLIAGIGKLNWYSIEKAKHELDYEPTSIEDSMKEAYEWYRGNNVL